MSTPDRSQPPLILIVDDEPDVVFMLESRLLSWGYRVRSASDGRAAISSALEERPDLVVMDLQMPVLDGRLACRHFKSDPRLCGIPIILVTASAEYIQKEQMEEGMADAYVIKPFDAADLKGQIQRSLTAGPQPPREK